MSVYKNKPINTKDIKRYSLSERHSKVAIDDFAKPYKKGASFKDFADSLPRFLGADTLQSIADRISAAREKGKAVILAMGAHPIKVGLNPLIIQWMEEGVLTALVVNGAAMIHDFEIAYQGATSEDVSAEIDSGQFGMAKETGSVINTLLKKGVNDRLGLGESLGRGFEEESLTHKELSIFCNAYKLKIPVTVHVAIGTDIIHYHPEFDPVIIGKGTDHDFRLLADCCKNLHDGGVFINMGSAVILPEIFLKIVTLLRNLGHPLSGINTVNMDFTNQYRPRVNIVQRPTQKGGEGFMLFGHHEINFPLLTALVMEKVK